MPTLGRGIGGAAGAAGTVWREGPGAPSSGLGIDGDFYINSSNGDYYRRVSGAYTLVANLTGPPGGGGGGSGGPLAIGDPITGGAANDILIVDPSGNLGQANTISGGTF